MCENLNAMAASTTEILNVGALPHLQRAFKGNRVHLYYYFCSSAILSKHFCPEV